MQALSASDFLRIWENGVGTTPVEQALVMLKAALPQADDQVLAGLTIGQRDRYLLHLRALTLGPRLKGLSNCPACNERLEIALDIHDLLPLDTSLPLPDALEPLNAEGVFQSDSYEVTYRLPTSADLTSLAGVTTTVLARQQLLEECVLSVRREGQAAAVNDLPSHMVKSLIDSIGDADPLANLTLSATCPACGYQWQLIFDIVSYFWSEIAAWAVRLIREVHLLASTYGWPEGDILAMSAWRRHRYLDLIGV